MANVCVNFDKTVGKIKPMHAVGQPPFTSGGGRLDFSPMQILTDAHVPYSRLHDVGGAYAANRYVDIPNIFRNFDADENDPASYDFAFTDLLIEGMISHGVEPYFRLGVTIENQCQIKAYRIHPPKDYGKWARICEHIIRHYNEGWADGFYYNITYWEIWNEPDNTGDPKTNPMWTGTPKEYYQLYDVTAKHLKACFGDKIKVGGYAASTFNALFYEPEKYGLSITSKRYDTPEEFQRRKFRVDFFLGFVEYIKAHGSPIDYFSWHAYGDIDVAPVISDFIDRVFTENGYAGLETHLNEWNLSHDREINLNNSRASASVAAMMITMQHKKTDMLMYYDAKYISVSAYGGCYDVTTRKPSCIYYAIRAFGDLYALGNEVECKAEGEELYALAARDGEKKAILLSNRGEDKKLKLDIPDGFYVYLIDRDSLMVKTELNPKEFTLKGNTVALVKNFE